MNKKKFMFKLIHQIKSDHLSIISAAMAYYALFSFVPAISSVVLIYTWISDPKDIPKHISLFSKFIPSEIQNILIELFNSLARGTKSTLGISTFTALLLTLWAASRGNRSIIDGLSIIYRRNEKMGLIRSFFLSLGMTMLGAILGVMTIGVVVIIPIVTHFFDLGDITEITTTVLSWSFLLTIFSFFLTFIYQYVAHEKSTYRWINIGASLASMIWIIVSGLFSWYVKEFGSYNKTYGSLGAIIILMLWFYLTSYAILLGAEINMIVEKDKDARQN